MPAKKKKGGGKAKAKGRKGKKAEPELTPEQLEHKALVDEAEALKRQLQEEAEDINVFQQQRVRRTPTAPCTYAALAALRWLRRMAGP